MDFVECVHSVKIKKKCLIDFFRIYFKEVKEMYAMRKQKHLIFSKVLMHHIVGHTSKTLAFACLESLMH